MIERKSSEYGRNISWEEFTKIMAPNKTGICMRQAKRVNKPIAIKKPPTRCAKTVYCPAIINISELKGTFFIRATNSLMFRRKSKPL